MTGDDLEYRRVHCKKCGSESYEAGVIVDMAIAAGANDICATCWLLEQPEETYYELAGCKDGE